MRIALFGGRFDPPHGGHQLVIEQLLEQKIVDEVWLVPVYSHPFQKKMSSAEDRLAMLEMLVAQLPESLRAQVRIEPYELESRVTNYSVDTLRALAKLHPKDTFAWVIGADNLTDFGQWDRYQELLQEFTVYVYPRSGFSPMPLKKGMVYLEKFPAVAISATEVRKRIQAGQSIDDLVPPAVEQYLQKHKLYQL